jgi:isopentenyldiphosphate isomerase
MPDELLDIVNDDDIVTGQNLRSVIHNNGFQHRGVHVFLFTHDGRLLVQRRSKDRTASPSLLDCSISEHVRAGEDYLTAAIRGLKEELGLDSIDIQPIVTFKMNYGLNDNEISRVFQGFVDPVKVQFDPVELEAVYYFSWSDLLERMTADGIAFCTWFIQMVNWAIGRPSQLGVLEFHNKLQYSFDVGLNGSNGPKMIFS